MSTPTREPTPDDALSEYVGAKVSQLQAKYLKRVPNALATMARLRHGVTAPPGSVPDIWEDTLGELPKELTGRTDDPNAWETAAHFAITLHAVHQQSRIKPMHRGDGATVGRAAAKLGQVASAEAVRRRFHIIATATTPDARLTHLRGLITQLRSESIPLDYGQLSVDLRRLSNPNLVKGVILRWGRDFHFKPANPEPATGETA